MFPIVRARYKSLLPALTIAIALALALSSAAFAGGPVVHQVSVGGPDFCEAMGAKPGCDKNFSLSAREYSDGTVTGQYTDRFGLGLGGFHATIDCLYVEGNQAWVSGIVTHGALLDPDEGELDLTGWPVATRVRDNGTSANDPPDEISYSWLEAGAFDCNTHPEVVLFEVPQGQVTVK